MSEPVLAAGGVLRRGDGRIAVVHRPRYDDWSLPKGKSHPGETAEDTARREVEEETGMPCRLGPEIGTTDYTDGRGRHKVVRYWWMEPVDERPFVPNDEVDELRWCSATEAATLLSYRHDRALVADAVTRLGEGSMEDGT